MRSSSCSTTRHLPYDGWKSSAMGKHAVDRCIGHPVQYSFENLRGESLFDQPWSLENSSLSSVRLTPGSSEVVGCG